jgi:hypothetical protein
MAERSVEESELEAAARIDLLKLKDILRPRDCIHRSAVELCRGAYATVQRRCTCTGNFSGFTNQ